METVGRQPGTPSAPRKSKGGAGGPACPAGRFPRPRHSALPLLSGFAFLLMFAAAPVCAQQQQHQWPGPPGSVGYPASQGGFPPDSQTMPIGSNPGASDPFVTMESSLRMPSLMPFDNSQLINTESCQTWTAAAVDSPTVSVARLAVPGKARHEFQKACGDFKGHKLKSAERHARKAVKIYPDYAAAWVILGQILDAKHDDKGAAEACRQGMKVDPKYAPPYICLAGFAARAHDWDEAYSLSHRALSLDPATDPYAFLYTATADLHLNRLDQAKLYGLSAEKLDKWHKIPQVHLLLAKVYEASGDQQAEAKELHKFLKHSPHNAVWKTVKTTLTKIEADNAK